MRIMVCFIFCLCVTQFSVHAYAVDDDVPRDCGEIRERSVRDTFELSYELRFTFPRIGRDLVTACEVMHSFEEWFDALPRERQRDRDIKDKVKQNVDYVEQAIKDLESPLRVYRVWYLADVDNKIARAVRAKNLNDAFVDIDRKYRDLRRRVHHVRQLVQYDGKIPQSKGSEPSLKEHDDL